MPGYTGPSGPSWARWGAAPAWLIAACGVLIGGMLLIKKDRFPGMDALKIASAAASVALAVMEALE